METSDGGERSKDPFNTLLLDTHEKLIDMSKRGTYPEEGNCTWP